MPVGVLAFAVGGALCLVLGFFGAVGTYALCALAALTVITMVTSVRRYRPSSSWQWYAICAAMMLFFVGSAASGALGTLGNLTAHRSIIPDVITIPGYLVLAAGLLGFTRARTSNDGRSLGVVLDALVVSLAIFACAWVYIIEPVLLHRQTPLDIRLVLVCYPTASVFLVVVTVRIAFGPDLRRSPSYWFLLTAMCAMLIGDWVYMLTEIHILHLPSGLLDLPYGLAYVGAGLMALHPSMRSLTEHTGRTEHAERSGRTVIVIVALFVPALLLLTPYRAPAGDRVVLFGIILALTFTAVARMAQALHESERSESRLLAQAMQDSLTGLPNRRSMRAQLTEVLERAEVANTDVAVLYLDLDQFKVINDTLGHTLGDELISRVARRLSESVRAGDLVTRLGGDEFIVVLEQMVDGTRAFEVAERIRGCLRVPFVVDGNELLLSASIGLAFARGRGRSATAEELVRDADLAMYQAKNMGRGAVVVFEQSMGTKLAERVSLEQELRHAVDRRELRLVYQPVVELPWGPVLGVEALIRWEHPTLGPLEPATFIPLAEESGLIVEIGGWVLDEALRQLARWRHENPDFENVYVAVNLSALQLRDDHLVEQVADALARHGLPGGALVLELTETVLMEDGTSAADKFTRLKRIGVRVAIDDFGTEYSSLTYLRRIPFDILKVDRSFISSLGEPDNPDETLIAAIVGMAKGLGIATVAEGVETSEQATRVVELGCDAVQGYVYSRPVESDQVLDVVAGLPGWAEIIVTKSL